MIIDPNAWLIMAEGIALSVIGAAGYLQYRHLTQDAKNLQPARYLMLAVIVGIMVFAALGEPSASSIPYYIGAGAMAPAYFKDIMVPWWKAD